VYDARVEPGSVAGEPTATLAVIASAQPASSRMCMETSSPSSAAALTAGAKSPSKVIMSAWRALGPHRFLAVSDTTAALGMVDGDAVLGTNEIVVADGTVRLHDGTLAGSTASLTDCLQVLLQVTGCSLADALATATTTPSRVLGDQSRGRLDVGCRGDVVLLEHDATQASLRPVVTVVAGELVHDQRVDGP